MSNIPTIGDQFRKLYAEDFEKKCNKSLLINKENCSRYIIKPEKQVTVQFRQVVEKLWIKKGLVCACRGGGGTCHGDGTCRGGGTRRGGGMAW